MSEYMWFLLKSREGRKFRKPAHPHLSALACKESVTDTAFRTLFRRWFHPISFTDSSEYEAEELASLQAVQARSESENS